MDLINKYEIPSGNREPGKTLDSLSNEEKKTIDDLKNLYMETIDLDVALQHEIYNIEQAYEKKHHEIFNKRKDILDVIRHNAHGDGNKQPNLINFWQKVMMAAYTEFIGKKDEKILSHLTDVRSKLSSDPVVKFVLSFHFEPNDYFTNAVLTKTYYLNCLPDPKDPLAHDGAEIFKCEGCKIDWKKEQQPNSVAKPGSFFDFFNPPQLPETDDRNYFEVNNSLQNDFELGFYIKERVIPKAVMFFTGEIADCMSSDEDAFGASDDDEAHELEIPDEEIIIETPREDD